MIRSLIFLLLWSNLWAQEEAAYLKKSISYFDALYYSNYRVNAMTKAKENRITSSIRTGLSLPRFYFMPLPKVVVNNVVAKASQQGGASMQNVATWMSSEIGPLMQEAMENQVLEKAQSLQEEWQEESFVAIKAKSLDLNAEQYLQFMNSAYIYIPTFESLHEKSRSLKGNKRLYIAEIKLGIVWFQVKQSENGIPSVVLVKKIVVEGRGESSSSVLNSSANAKASAFENAISQAIENLVVETKSMDAFKLTAQILQGGVFSSTIDADSSAGIALDDVFEYYEVIEKADGTTKKNDLGWGFVSNVGKGDSTKTNLRIVSGAADQGNSLRENPFSLYSFEFGGLSKHLDFDPARVDSARLSVIGGPFFAAYVSVGPDVGFNHLYFGIEGGFFLANARGEWESPTGIKYQIENYVSWNSLLKVKKKFHIFNRLFAYADIAGGGEYAYLDAREGGEIRVFSLLVEAGIGGEFTFTPSFAIYGGMTISRGTEFLVEYKEETNLSFGSDEDTEDFVTCDENCLAFKYSDIGIKIGLSWRLKKISNNPFSTIFNSLL
jgi:hypothetical protein